MKAPSVIVVVMKLITASAFLVGGVFDLYIHQGDRVSVALFAGFLSLAWIAVTSAMRDLELINLSMMPSDDEPSAQSDLEGGAK